MTSFSTHMLDLTHGRPAAAVADVRTDEDGRAAHIEQGPVLEAENLPIGIVTAIANALPNDSQREQAGAGLDRLTPRRLTHEPASEIAEAIAQIGLINRLRLFDVVIA